MRKRILFVDDERPLLDLLQRTLRDRCDTWDMSFAMSADQALEQAHSDSFDAIVTDITMPGKSGFDLLEALRTSVATRGIPVIVLTGLGEENLKRRALDLGATDLLSKPVHPDDLLARIRSVLRMKSDRDQITTANRLLERKVRERTAELEESRLDILWRLAKAGEYRDEETGSHTARVACYCQSIATALNMPGDFTEMIFWTSPLHDLGKIGISDEILLKRGKLSPGEWKTMKTHSFIGARILEEETKGMKLHRSGRRTAKSRIRSQRDNPWMRMAATIALSHHERWDGKGYPQGLAGEKIPPEARIAALADTYDALCSARPYKPAYPEEKTLDIINHEEQGHFDPKVLAAFQKVTPEFSSIRRQLADGGDRAPQGQGSDGKA